MPGIAFDLLAQTADEYIDRTRSYKRAFFPDRIKQLIAGKDASAMTSKILEQAKLANRSKYGLALHAHGHGCDIDFQITELNNLGTGSFRLGPKHVADAGNQFTRTERLGDVSVSANIESLQAIRFQSLGGEEYDGSSRQLLVLANLAAEIEAADTGQH